MRTGYFLGVVIIILIISCHKNDKGYYIISKQDATLTDQEATIKANHKKPIEPKYEMPSFVKYSDIEFIFDSTDRVYITLTKSKNLNTQKKDKDIIKDYPYPNYIGFAPEDFIAFNSNYFIQFIKDNDDIFLLDTIHRNSSLYFFIASTKDTIKNKAFYELIDLIHKNSKGSVCRIFYIVRKTTEEEDKVIYYKRKGIDYRPSELSWSTHFLTGEFRPFTSEYDSIEKTCRFQREPQKYNFNESIKIKRID